MGYFPSFKEPMAKPTRSREFLVVHTNAAGSVKAVAAVEATSKQEANVAVNQIRKDLKVSGLSLQVLDTEQVMYYVVSNGKLQERK